MRVEFAVVGAMAWPRDQTITITDTLNRGYTLPFAKQVRVKLYRAEDIEEEHLLEVNLRVSQLAILLEQGCHVKHIAYEE